MQVLNKFVLLCLIVPVGFVQASGGQREPRRDSFCTRLCRVVANLVAKKQRVTKDTYICYQGKKSLDSFPVDLGRSFSEIQAEVARYTDVPPHEQYYFGEPLQEKHVAYILQQARADRYDRDSKNHLGTKFQVID